MDVDLEALKELLDEGMSINEILYYYEKSNAPEGDLKHIKTELENYIYLKNL